MSLLLLSFLSCGLRAEDEIVLPSELNSAAAIASPTTEAAEPAKYTVFSVFYSASSGRALIGLVDRFYAGRFADCSAPKGGFHSSIELSDLKDCNTVPGSLFLMSKQNLASIYNQLPRSMKRVFIDGLDPVGAADRARIRFTADAGFSVAMTLLISYLYRDIARWRPRLSLRFGTKLAFGGLLSYVGLKGMISATRAWREYRRGESFPAFEGYVYGLLKTSQLDKARGKAAEALGFKAGPSKTNEPFHITRKTMPLIFELLREAILNSVERLPSA